MLNRVPVQNLNGTRAAFKKKLTTLVIATEIDDTSTQEKYETLMKLFGVLLAANEPVNRSVVRDVTLAPVFCQMSVVVISATLVQTVPPNVIATSTATAKVCKRQMSVWNVRTVQRFVATIEFHVSKEAISCICLRSFF